MQLGIENPAIAQGFQALAQALLPNPNLAIQADQLRAETDGMRASAEAERARAGLATAQAGTAGAETATIQAQLDAAQALAAILGANPDLSDPAVRAQVAAAMAATEPGLSPDSVAGMTGATTYIQPSAFGDDFSNVLLGTGVVDSHAATPAGHAAGLASEETRTGITADAARYGHDRDHDAAIYGHDRDHDAAIYGHDRTYEGRVATAETAADAARYGHDRTYEGRVATAETAAEAARYGHDQDRAGRETVGRLSAGADIIGSRLSAAAARLGHVLGYQGDVYGADVAAEADRDVADINAGARRYGADASADATRDAATTAADARRDVASISADAQAAQGLTGGRVPPTVSPSAANALVETLVERAEAAGAPRGSLDALMPQIGPALAAEFQRTRNAEAAIASVLSSLLIDPDEWGVDSSGVTYQPQAAPATGAAPSGGGSVAVGTQAQLADGSVVTWDGTGWK